MTLSFPIARQQEAVARLLWVYRVLGFEPQLLLQQTMLRLPPGWDPMWTKRLTEYVIHNPFQLHNLTGV